MGEQLKGLYLFRDMYSMSVAMAHSQNMVSSDLLHRRLGYPASKNMDMLHLSDSSTAGFDSKYCEFV